MALAQRRLFPTTYRIQPITIHRLVPAVRPPLLHVATASSGQQFYPQKAPSVAFGSRVTSHIYSRNSYRSRSTQKVKECHHTEEYRHQQESKRRSCENLILKEEEESTPIRAAKSLSALHGRTFVSKLVIPHLRNVRSFSVTNRRYLK